MLSRLCLVAKNMLLEFASVVNRSSANKNRGSKLVQACRKSLLLAYTIEL
jgi:hypothetical protein